MDGLAAGPGAARSPYAGSQNNDKPLSSGACRVYAALRRMAGDASAVAAAFDAISDESGCSHTTVARALTELRIAELVEQRRRPKDQGPYEYGLATPNVSQRAWIASERLSGQRAVYFVKGGDKVKIGCTGHVRTRFEQLRMANAGPIELIGVAPGGNETEKLLHEELAEHRSHGEWFFITPAVDWWMQEVCL